MKILTIKKRYYNSRNLLALEFHDEDGISSGIIIPAYESQYYYANIIYHLIVNYPKVLRVKLNEYKTKVKTDDWEDEFDGYSKSHMQGIHEAFRFVEESHIGEG